MTHTTINHRGVTSSTVIQSKHPLLGRRLACLMDGKVGLALKTTDNVCLHVQKKIVNDSTIFVDDSTIFVDNSTIFLDTLASTMHSWMTWQHRHVLKTKHSWMRWQQTCNATCFKHGLRSGEHVEAVPQCVVVRGRGEDDTAVKTKDAATRVERRMTRQDSHCLKGRTRVNAMTN